MFAAPAPEPAVQSDAVAVTRTDQSITDTLTAKRAELPAQLTSAITLIDINFQARMRIMQYAYVANTPDTDNLNAFIEGRSETLCLEARSMFGTGVTLRNSFVDTDGNLLGRIYLLDEDCQRFH